MKHPICRNPNCRQPVLTGEPMHSWCAERIESRRGAFLKRVKPKEEPPPVISGSVPFV